MTLNKNNYFAKYYNWVYGYYPQDVCSFFWGSILGIGLGVFMTPTKLIAFLFDPDYDFNKRDVVVYSLSGLVFYLLSTLVILTGSLVLGIFGYEFTYWWSLIFGGFFLGGLLIISIILAGWGIVSLFKRTKTKLPETHLIDNTVDFIAAIRGKYCTKITWTENETT